MLYNKKRKKNNKKKKAIATSFMENINNNKTPSVLREVM